MEGKQFEDIDNSESMIPKNKLEWLPPAWNWGIIIMMILFLGLIWYFLVREKHKDNVIKPIPVVSAVATVRDVPLYLSALGSVTPKYSVSVRTQLNGILFKVLFTEGQMVKTGDLLAQIDPRPYEALLIQYEGNLKRDTALLANAKIDLKRYQRLWKQDSISQQTLATQIALVEQYEGAVKTDLGLIQSTKVSLIYTRITSPVDGRIGLRLVDPGNVVQTSDTNGIAVVNTLNPITVIFTLPEDNVPQIVPQVYANKKMVVQAFDRQQSELLATGTLLTIDNQINQSTGTVKLRAIFDNKDNKLFPNQFVNARILVETLHQATVVPTAAIQHSTTKGDFVYLVNKNSTVTVKLITSGPASENQTVIKAGIKPGQSVVVEGADKLRDGSKVVVGSAAKLFSHSKKRIHSNSERSIA
ncbi:efflux RND transporter periplasmic adaptor subunit [Legionella maioricensis]|uniref:Efflux RND transporter periplasmic adaptor subunit n=1 Tax=Legionella maioricensis TaxID=2896528 RepID=A0A9X2CXS6_9GAMM|nr:efflux RND transporter periplasmic adaptor subunit [Legionella maioricensis]MCL9682679.1 efflux RND transporter periplasmic adaptor subunit [Legionella maioricensis]MCL9687274.1 efflux RND transporter periplasmic adaptor subunit [Legionella maioricensis]